MAIFEVRVCFIELQIPAKPDYSFVFYFGSERPIAKESLLDRFVNGTDMFRDSRFKLIPSIVEVHAVLRFGMFSPYFHNLTGGFCLMFLELFRDIGW